MEGAATVKSIVPEGDYLCEDTIAVLTGEDGEDIAVTMVQKWPVKVAMTNYKEKPRPFKLLETGVRTIDTMNPIVEGGTGIYSGAVRYGKDGAPTRHLQAGRGRYRYHCRLRGACQRGGGNLYGVPRTGRSAYRT